MDDLAAKRQALYDLPYGRVWQMKVERMKDSQLIAIYLRFKAQGKV